MWRSVQNALERYFELRERDPAQGQRALDLAAAALLVEVSRADAHVGEAEEHAMLDAIERACGLPHDAAQALLREAEALSDRAVSLSDFTRLLKDRLGRDERVRVIELLWRVAWADGRIDKYEDYWVRRIADLLYVSHADFIRAKLATQPVERQ